MPPRSPDLLDNPVADELFAAFISLKTVAECRAFMRDLCTLSELEAMIERFQVVKLLQVGLPYRQISQQTGASTATVTRVAHWLNNGMGGYATILQRAHKRRATVKGRGDANNG